MKPIHEEMHLEKRHAVVMIFYSCECEAEVHSISL